MCGQSHFGRYHKIYRFSLKALVLFKLDDLKFKILTALLCEYKKYCWHVNFSPVACVIKPEKFVTKSLGKSWSRKRLHEAKCQFLVT